MSIATEIERIKKAKENIINTLKANDIQIEETATIDKIDIVMNDVPILDTSDATATAEDIRKGKTAYVKDKKITGSLEIGTGGTSGLSSDYQQVEYIESTGTQYINTGVCPQAGVHSAVVNFVLTKKVKNREQWAFGQYTNAGWRCGGSTSTYDIFNLDTSNGFSYTDAGYQYKTLGMSTKCNITSDYPMLLFAQQEGGNAGYLDASYFKIYECKIWENEKLIRDFIPCYRKSDGEAGMFDVVNGVFYTNQGTGSFVVGSETLPYKKLEYIENTDANQYIDTGVQALSTFGVELDIQTITTDSVAFLGAWKDGKGLLLGQHNGYHNPEEKGYYYATSETWRYTGVPFDSTKFHKIIYDPVNSTITVDETTINVVKNTGIQINMWLFRAYEWQEATAGVRISRCKIYNNRTLIRDYIPVKRNSDGVVCMYDLVENKYYLPSNGTLIAGPEI